MLSSHTAHTICHHTYLSQGFATDVYAWVFRMPRKQGQYVPKAFGTAGPECHKCRVPHVLCGLDTEQFRWLQSHGIDKAVLLPWVTRTPWGQNKKGGLDKG